MKEKVQRVVGIAFIKDGKLLIVQSHRSKKTNSWTFVGGGVEEKETLIEACIREVSEEIHNSFTIEASDLEPVMSFKESAASDPHKMIEMSIYLCRKEINVPLTPNEEILEYHWYRFGEEGYNVSSSIKEHFVPYAVEKGIMY